MVCVEMATRIAPGVELWFGPAPKSMAGAYAGFHFPQGRYGIPRPVCIISTGYSSPNTASMVIHEAAHAVADLLTEDEIAILNAAMSRGPTLACPYQGDGDERYARLVADCGMVMHATDRFISSPIAPETEVIARILSGEVGRRRLRQPIAAPKPSVSTRFLVAVGLGALAHWLETPAEEIRPEIAC